MKKYIPILSFILASCVTTTSTTHTSATQKRPSKKISNTSYKKTVLKEDTKTNTSAIYAQNSKKVPPKKIITFTYKPTIYPNNPKSAPLLKLKELNKKKVYKSIAEALKNPAEVYRLHLRAIINKKEIKFEPISKDIGKLYNLQELILYNPMVASLPKEIGMLKNLQVVDIQGTKYETQLPLEVINWTHLKEARFFLNAKNVQANFMDPICSIPSINKITISGKGIKRVPKEMYRIQKLKNLIIRNTPNLNELDYGIAYIPNLRKLTLENVPIQSIPNSFGNAFQIDKIVIENCKKLKNIPEYLLHKDKATFTYNRILTITKSGFIKNKITGINVKKALEKTDKSNVIKISALRIEDNIKEETAFCNANFSNLEIYETPVPKNIPKNTLSKLKILKIMQVYGNKAICKNLEHFFSKTPNLEYLNIRNKLCEIPTGVYQLQKLKYFDIKFFESGNKPVKIIDKIANLKNLKRLSIGMSSNFSMQISTKLYNLKNLKTLLLTTGGSKDKPTKFVNLPIGIEKLTNLEHLSIYMLKTVPIGLGKMKNLKFLRISSYTISKTEILKLKQKLPNTIIKFNNSFI